MPPPPFDRIADSLLTGLDAGVRAFALAYGYTPAELASVPVAANLGLMCGCPLRFADLRPGEVVIDVGSGGGLDAILAAAAGCQVTGFDRSPAMVARAEVNGRGRGVMFRVADLEALPVPAASVDCVLSNNAFHYADPAAAVAEAARVLKPGGRLVFCDLTWMLAQPDAVTDDEALHLAGVRPVAEVDRLLRRHGFATCLSLTEPAVLPPRPAAGPGDDARLGRWVEASQGCCGVDPPDGLSCYHDALAKCGPVLTTLVRATKPRT